MVTDETPLDDENGGDSETIVQKPLTLSQKVIQNIHNNFLRALRLSRARPEVLDYVRREFECPACAAKGHPPKPRLPAALPRTFRFNETLGVDLFEVESPDSSKIVFCNIWFVGVRCTNCAFLFWTKLLRMWLSVLQSGGSSILVLRW